jgi:hypothetical protein
MGSIQPSQGSGSWLSTELANNILYYVHFCYPLTLLIIFLVSFVWHSIVTSPSNQAVSSRSTILGPGGKPLPPNSRPPSNSPPQNQNPGFGRIRSLLFCWLSVGLIFSYIGSAINIVVHALVERNAGWWCGEATAVSTNPCCTLQC